MSTIAKAYKPVVRAKTKDGSLSGAALVGINSILLGWSVDDHADRKHLLGFGIRRTDYEPETGKMIRSEWFYGNKRFSHQIDKDYGPSISSYSAPYQRFNWSDYSVSPNRSYLYEIFPYWGEPRDFSREEPLKLYVRPTAELHGDWGIFTNRGVTSSLAYQERFKSVNPAESQEAQIWLSRGLKESLLNVIKEAVKGDGLHIAIYEFEDNDVAEALQKAVKRGVDVQIVFHAVKGNGSVGKAREENLHCIKDNGLEKNAFPREKPLAISHNKFLVLLKAGVPHTVWTGTCNFTFAGFYLQTNMALQLSEATTAGAYEAYFQLLKSDPEGAPVRAGVEAIIEKTEKDLEGESWKVNFSPVSRDHLLEYSAEQIRKAKSAVFMSTPFGLDKSLLDAIAENGKQIIEYGLCNSAARKRIEALNFSYTRFFTPSRLESYMGRQWDAKAFGNNKIHTKSLVTDPWGDNPVVIVGTGNFSDEACRRNDENFLMVEGDRRLAAVVSTEFIRMWEHYKNRHFINAIYGKRKATEKEEIAQMLLKGDGSWSDTAYREHRLSYKFREREVFAGME
ncbi:MAG: phospholipase D-like domain-containing protein [Saprospiraceae bacterium]